MDSSDMLIIFHHLYILDSAEINEKKSRNISENPDY